MNEASILIHHRFTDSSFNKTDSAVTSTYMYSIRIFISQGSVVTRLRYDGIFIPVINLLSAECAAERCIQHWGQVRLLNLFIIHGE